MPNSTWKKLLHNCPHHSQDSGSDYRRQREAIARCTFWPGRLILLALTLLLTSACGNHSELVDEEPIVRGLKAHKVTQSASAELRRYPSVVQPAQESKLSFEVGGKLKDITLEVGQKVNNGDVLAEIDTVSLNLKVEQTRASLDETKASLRNAKLDYDRKKQLLEKNYVTQSEFDSASTQLKSLQAKVSQTERQLELAQEDLSKAKLISPFDGVISSIEVQDYAQVSAGSTVLGLYSENAYEVRFSVPAVIINSLTVGDPARITFSDLPGQDYVGHIKELGSRAEQVSAFPVVVTLDDAPGNLRAGIAADVELQIALANSGEGFLIPLTSFSFDPAIVDADTLSDYREPQRGAVFVYDQSSQTVQMKEIGLMGIRGNMAIVVEGLSEGDIVASAGVSYLYHGQRVNLLPLE